MEVEGGAAGEGHTAPSAAGMMMIRAGYICRRWGKGVALKAPGFVAVLRLVVGVLLRVDAHSPVWYGSLGCCFAYANETNCCRLCCCILVAVGGRNVRVLASFRFRFSASLSVR